MKASVKSPILNVNVSESETINYLDKKIPIILESLEQQLKTQLSKARRFNNSIVREERKKREYHKVKLKTKTDIENGCKYFLSIDIDV